MKRKNLFRFLAAFVLLGSWCTMVQRQKTEEAAAYSAAGITEDELSAWECCVQTDGKTAESGETSDSSRQEEEAALENASAGGEETESTETEAAWATAAQTSLSYADAGFSSHLGEDGKTVIRVLIGTSGYESLLHDSILLTSDQEFVLEGEEQDAVYAAGTEVDITPSFLTRFGGSVTARGEGSWVLKNVQRSCGYPDYPGTLRITNEGGRLSVVNELPLETYLTRVVPGEMPASYGENALRAQAVCARSYSLCQMSYGRNQEYGADVDDSSASQVYNNQEPEEAAEQAVKDTEGMVVMSGGRIAETWYYSTSCGNGADMTVWGEDNSAYPWIAAHSQDSSRTTLNLSGEDAFRQFLESAAGAWDADSEWYRWQTKRSAEKMTELAEEYAEKTGAGGIGDVREVSVTERLACGSACELTVRGSDGALVVSGVTEVREFLGSSGDALSLQNGTEHDGTGLLPSAFFWIEEEEDGWSIHGGGFGHGVGLSQDGARGMDQAGYSWEEILTFYFNDITIGCLT